MLISFGILQSLGMTLNMVVLFSLILALGMLVDNGIVIVENIYRHMQEGEGRLRAALNGTTEVGWPVITSTLTTLCAFFPMLFWPGIMGRFMSFLPKTLMIALSASLFVALVVNPTFCAVFLKAKEGGTLGGGRPWIIGFYERFLRWVLGHRGLFLVSAFVMLVVSFVAFALWGKGVEFFPQVEPNRAFVTVKAPEGTNLEASDELVRPIEKQLMSYRDIQFVIANVGAGGALGEPGGGTHVSRVSMDFVDAGERKRKSSEIIKEARRIFRTMVGAEITVKKEEHGPPTGMPVNLEISGDDFKTLGAIARQVRERIKDVPGIVDLKDDYVLGKPEIRVEIDKEKASLLGLDTLTIANTVKAAINGVKAGVYRVLDEEIDIIARLPDKDRHSISDIERLTISDDRGRPIPLTSVARVVVSSGLGSINRIDQKRVVTVQSDVAGRLTDAVLRDVKQRLSDLKLPRGYSISYTGQRKEEKKAQAFLSKAFLAAIFLISLVLITQFDSISLPLIIMTSVLLSLIGVFWGLLVTGLPFGVLMTGIGVISLAGVVVNNAIVLIDYIGQLRDRGLGVAQALVQACTVRFRPVMLTAITTILGLIPMATGVSFDFTRLRWDVGGESSQWWGPMAVAVIFGLAVATVLTLGVVPALYSVLESSRSRLKKAPAA